MYPWPLLAGLNSTFPAWSLIANGLLRAQQNPRCYSRHLPCSAGDELHRRRAFCAAYAGEAGLRNRGKGRGARRGKGSRARSLRAHRDAVADRLRGKGRRCGEEMRCLPHLREGRPQSRRSEPLRDRGGQAGREPRGFQFLGCHEGEGRHLDRRRPQQVHCQSEVLYPGHRDGLCRHPQGQRARRRNRLPAHAFG